MQRHKTGEMSRREFVKTTAAVMAATSAFPHLVRGQESGKPLKVGLIGCGGRGTGAAQNALEADPNVKIVALADVFKDRLEGCRKALKDKGKQEIEDKMCFEGFDAYKKLLETNVDYVILATPPYYRPPHFAACIDAGKHVFMEKPVAVDPPGVRKIMAAGKKAAEKGLSVVAGTQRRHQKGYIETIKRIHDGAIGKILSAQAYWNGGQLWYRLRENGWSDMDWMIRDWVNWIWLSGDHIVEQHVHNLDVMNWVLGTHPRKVVGMGGRARRVTGDQFDFFACDFFYPNPDSPDKPDTDLHVLSQCRQINGCTNDVSERVIGDKGVSNCNGWVSSLSEPIKGEGNPYVQEHADLIAAIRGEKPINEAQQVAESTLCGIMGRMSAYTGKAITWDDAMKCEVVLGPPDYELTEENIKAGVIKAHVHIPGKA
jgi:myo-inositol 2-dehydrogenase/D-chiro-inositol 1-dehydrogenase